MLESQAPKIVATADASNTIFSTQYQQTYHSTHGAITESRHVFLHGSGVSDRLTKGQPTKVLEIGFGLGLNCVITADCAEANATALTFVSVEHAPITARVFRELQYEKWVSHSSVIEGVALALDAADNKCTTLGQCAELHLHRTDASGELFNSSILEPQRFHAVYLDAFSPDVNPECWTLSFLQSLAACMCDDAVLATYCVKGSVQRLLKQAGFVVQKFPGPPGKREVLRATKSSVNRCSTHSTTIW